eukprot:TRINITY_DN7715_c0_g1_i4.p1 TRINITY_DN7715_c0_g1~~TRINITY_DN7715_c0_g1_i4.p1  ORF type:complete len:280 (-),score=36.32 TRINITY_DN7715_c0_g1_i4:338-1123(-)
MASGPTEGTGDAAANEYHKFLAALHEDDQCDIILVCSPRPTSRTRRAERFYCRRQDLSRRCQAFASMQSFEASCSTVRTVEFTIPASGDIVLEVLRYAYTGVLLFPPAFRERFGELLVTVDFLGMCYGAEHSLEYMFEHRLWESSPRDRGSIFDALSLQDLLENISDDMLRQAFRGSMMDRHANHGNAPFSGRRGVGFATRQALLAKVAELRLRACGGPPPSDPFVIFDNFLRKSGSLEEANADESEEWQWHFAVERQHSV